VTDQILEARVRKLNAIVVLGGDLISVEAIPKIPRPFIDADVRSMDWTESDVGGACPSYERVLAASLAWQLNPKLVLIVSGGKSNVPHTNITITTARIIRLELEALGVAPNYILEEGESSNTFEQISNCGKILDSTRLNGLGRFGILSMGWHLTRLRIAMSHQSDTSFDDGVFLSAERLLVNGEADEQEFIPKVPGFPTWEEYFTALDATPKMRNRRINESLGIEQILTGYSSKYGQKPYAGFEDPLE
jgi:uncharacterized SAM-binding protein YcdF (DUF218 family)